MAPIRAQIRGVAITALQSAEALIENINKLADTPPIIKNLLLPLEAVREAMDDLKDTSEETWAILGAPLSDLAYESFKMSLEIVDDLNKSIWLKSEDGQLAVAPRVATNRWRQQRIAADDDALWTCQCSLVEISNVELLESLFFLGGHPKEIEQIFTQQERSLEDFVRFNADRWWGLHDDMGRSVGGTDRARLDQKEREDVSVYDNLLAAEITLLQDGEKTADDVRGKLEGLRGRYDEIAKGRLSMTFSGDADVEDEVAEHTNSSQGLWTGSVAYWEKGT